MDEKIIDDIIITGVYKRHGLHGWYVYYREAKELPDGKILLGKFGKFKITSQLDYLLYRTKVKRIEKNK